MREQPTPQQVRRSLARVERGAALDVGEATALLAARGDDLDRLTAAAARVRDAGLVAAGRPAVVTYSPKVFIPITKLCRDRCHYCTFVESPGELRRAGHGMYLSPDEILDVAEAAVLLRARGDDLRDLAGSAARVRDAGLEAAGRPGVITYSR